MITQTDLVQQRECMAFIVFGAHVGEDRWVKETKTQ